MLIYVGSEIAVENYSLKIVNDDHGEIKNNFLSFQSSRQFAIISKSALKKLIIFFTSYMYEKTS